MTSKTTLTLILTACLLSACRQEAEHAPTPSIPRPTDWERLPAALRTRVETAVEHCAAHPDDPRAFKALGLLYHGNHESTLAARSYEIALARGAADARTPYLLGLIYEEWGRTDDATGMFRMSIDRQPAYAPAHYHLGRTLQEGGRFDDAIAALARARALNPSDAGVCVQLGRALRQAQRLPEAVDVLQAALRLDPQRASAHQLLGLTLRELQDPRADAHLGYGGRQRGEVVDDAWLAEVQRLVATREGILDHARSLMDAGRIGSAIETLRRGALEHPGSCRIYHLLGQGLAAQGDFEAAIAALDDAVSCDPGHIPARCDLATCYVATGDSNRAFEVVEAALTVSPDHADALALKGGLLVGRGEHAEAVAILRAVTARRRDHVLAHVSLGDALLALDRKDEAMAAYERAATLQPRWDYPRRQLEKLRSSKGSDASP